MLKHIKRVDGLLDGTLLRVKIQEKATTQLERERYT